MVATKCRRDANSLNTAYDARRSRWDVARATEAIFLLQTREEASRVSSGAHRLGRWCSCSKSIDANSVLFFCGSSLSPLYLSPLILGSPIVAAGLRVLTPGLLWWCKRCRSASWAGPLSSYRHTHGSRGSGSARKADPEPS